MTRGSVDLLRFSARRVILRSKPPSSCVDSATRRNAVVTDVNAPPASDKRQDTEQSIRLSAGNCRPRWPSGNDDLRPVAR